MADIAALLAASPLTLGGVKCASVSIQPRPGRDSSTGTWHIFCAADDCQALHAWFAGGPVTTTPTGGGDPVTTYQPTQTLPGWPGLYYTGAEITGILGEDGIAIDPTTGKINYKYADFVAQFQNQTFSFDSQQKGQPTMVAGVEVFTAPQGSMVWSDGTVVDQPPGISLPLLNVSLPFYSQTLANFEACINALQNPLNSAPMSVFGNAPAKHVLYTGSNTNWRSVYPAPVVDMVHQFSIRSKPWDMAIKPALDSNGNAVWDTFKLKGGGDAIGTSDLNQLLS